MNNKNELLNEVIKKAEFLGFEISSIRSFFSENGIIAKFNKKLVPYGGFLLANKNNDEQKTFCFIEKKIRNKSELKIEAEKYGSAKYVRWIREEELEDIKNDFRNLDKLNRYLDDCIDTAKGIELRDFEIFGKINKQISIVAKKYDSIWREIDDVRVLNSHKWQRDIFIPTDYVSEIVTKQINEFEIKNEYLDDYEELEFNYSDIESLAMFSAWRTTKGIYKFDESLFDALIKSDPIKNVPFSSLLQIPEYACFVVMQNKYYMGKKIVGFFYFLDDDIDAHGSNTNLRFNVVFLFKDDSTPQSFSFCKYSDHSITERLFDIIRDGDENIQRAINQSFFDKDKVINDSIETLECAFILILYISSQKPEYSGSKPSFPTPVKTKKGLRFFPPDKPKIIEIGKSIGEKLRQYEAAQEKQYIESGATKRPHIRRGHWHGVWTGARNSETPQTFKYNWLPPMGVNIEGGI